jgi:hypothetical protein
VRFEADESQGNLLAPGSYLRKFVVDRAAKFLHERWRVGYAQKHKDAYIAYKKQNNEIQNTAVADSRIGSGVDGVKSPDSPIGEEDIETTSYPVTKGVYSVSKLAEALWLKHEIRCKRYEIPPRWKSKFTYQSPPHDANGPTSKYFNGNEAQKEWVDPKTDICYVDINQPLENLPERAQHENMKSAESVLKLLEQFPQAPRTELADMLHRQWVDSRGTSLSFDNKLRNPWNELPMAEKIKNMVIVDAVIDMCALAHQIHDMVTVLFNNDGDGKISAEEFIMGELLRPLFKENVRVPVRKGDIIKVKDFGRNSNTYSEVVVVGWYQNSFWNHGVSLKQNQKQYKKNFLSQQKKSKSAQDVDVGPVIFHKILDTDNFFFSGTIFLVRVINEENRLNFSQGSVVLPQPNKVHFDLLNKGEIHAIPETAIYWKEICCNDFVRDMLGHSDWLFDSDGTCAINDHRCVPLKTSMKNDF